MEGRFRAMIGGPGPVMIRGFGDDSPLTRQQIKPGTVRRILPYLRSYRRQVISLVLLAVLGAVVTVSIPLLFKNLIDTGIIPRDTGIVVWLAAAVAGLALLEALMKYGDGLYSARIGEGLIYDLRSAVFAHVQ